MAMHSSVNVLNTGDNCAGGIFGYRSCIYAA